MDHHRVVWQLRISQVKPGIKGGRLMTDQTVPTEAPARKAKGLSILEVYAKLPAQDVERARAFYAEKVGLEPVRELDDHLFYEVGGSQFLLFPSSGAPSGTHDQFGLVVDDVEQAVTALEARGVALENYEPPPGATRRGPITDFGPVRAAWFKDSEGNLLSVAEFRGK
jgi:catechol 2,3-dioxygenase-like lactoylglutathione lyase family enzyme